MKTDILTPKNLFQKDVRYTIPPFQRPYVWTHEDQWEPLWDDVRNVAEDYLENRGMGYNNVDAERRTKPHFLGAIVLQQVDTATKDIEQREVIDGQQRVTTLQLLLDAVQQICEDLDLSIPARRLSRLVTNDADLVGENSDYVFKLWPTRTDTQAFRHAMDNGLAADDFEESLIVQAHNFFQRQVREWLQNSVGSIEDNVEALETAITGMLNLVVIDLDTPDDPNVIFDTLNARGTPLEQSDLIKNFVLSPGHGLNTAGLELWGNLDDPWWRREVRQGRLYRPRLDMLLNYWIAMRTGEEVSPTNVFSRFRHFVEERTVEDVMSLVRMDMDNYKRFQESRDSREEERFFYRTDVMQMGAVTPLLLLLLSSNADNRIKAFQALESYLIRRMVCRQTTKDYNRLVLELAIRLREQGVENADRVVALFLKEQTADSRKWPDDDTVISTMGTSPLYQLLTRGRLRLILEGIEERLRSTMAEHQDVPKGLTIEHIMPQSWDNHWPLSPNSGMDEDETRRERNRLVQTIGNLTLVTGRLNSTLSNAPWESKRETLLGHAVLNLNKELWNVPDWDEDNIRTRNRRFAELVTEIWPGPGSPMWDV